MTFFSSRFSLQMRPRLASLTTTLAAGGLGLVTSAALAQPAALPAASIPPAPSALAQALGLAVDPGRVYPSMMNLDVDLSDAARKIFKIRQSLKVEPGRVTLRYPKWIPGEHSPSGTLDGLTGIRLQGGGQRLTWRRDAVDMFSLHVQVPQGVTQLDIEFQYLSPIGGGAFGQSASATSRLAQLEWNQVLFYPAGYAVKNIPVQASVKVPEGWQFATALEKDADVAGATRFKTVSVEHLVDSPLFTGKHFKRIDLAPGAKRPVFLNVVADRAANLEMKPEQIDQHRALVKQAVALFGSEHYNHYDFLLGLSEFTGTFGLEHHQSSDDRVTAEFFTDPELYAQAAGLLPHEYAHSWNGKFRRPGGLTTPDYQQPMKGELLWVYEGLTTYLGNVLTARSGMWTPADYRDQLAITAATMNAVSGRTWRPLQDTTDEAQILYTTPRAWSNWRRGVDFYPEGELIWLDADTKIRELSKGARSLDDFVRGFFGIRDGSFDVVTYEFDDVIKGLQDVQPYDWRGFLRERLDSTQAGAPLDGLARAGYKLTFTAEPSKAFKGAEKQRKHSDRSHSIGIVINNDEGKGGLNDVTWGGPAFDAGLAPGMKLIAVNAEDYSSDVLDAAITEAAKSRKPIELLLKNGGTYQTVQVPYFGGHRYPHLVREGAGPDRIELIVKPRN